MDRYLEVDDSKTPVHAQVHGDEDEVVSKDVDLTGPPFNCGVACNRYFFKSLYSSSVFIHVFRLFTIIKTRASTKSSK